MEDDVPEEAAAAEIVDCVPLVGTPVRRKDAAPPLAPAVATAAVERGGRGRGEEDDDNNDDDGNERSEDEVAIAGAGAPVC